MKTLKLIMVIGIAILFGGLKAQVSVGINIGSPPPWGPVGYTEVRYYYLPDVEAYYDIQTSMFIYYGAGVWIREAYLPVRYRSYDLYSGYKVVMTDYHGNAPYTNFSQYKVKYAKGYRGGPQKTIGEKPGKGNARKRMDSKDSPPKKLNPGNGQGNSPANNKNVRKDQGPGGGKGKKK